MPIATMVIATATSGVALSRLLQLVSPSLPVGAYSFSQGLETAVEQGFVTSHEQTTEWLSSLLHQSLTRLDVPILLRFYSAWQQADAERLTAYNNLLLASRETSELRAEDLHMGAALRRLLQGLCVSTPVELPAQSSFALVYSALAVHWQIPNDDAVHGFLYAWLENQVLAAIKLVPLGQLAGQQILIQLGAQIPLCLEQAKQMEDADIGASMPLLAICSSCHEIQHSRLFRS